MAAVIKARTSLMDYMKLTMPDPDAPDDPTATRYEVTPQARLLCEVLEKVERGEMLRVCVSIGPQLGKSQIISRGFPSWYMGKNPFKHFMLGTYSQDFANDFGGEVRELMTAPFYKQVFPGMGFRKGSMAKDVLITSKSGRMNFLGRGGAGSGKPADCLARGTLVSTASGPIPIEQIVEDGESPFVYSINHKTGAVELRRVIAARTVSAKAIMEISLGDKKIRCTPDHRFFVVEHGYKRAEQIQPGDRVAVLRGMPEILREGNSGVRKTGSKREDAVFLQSQMSWPEHEEKVRGLRQADRKENKPLLLKGVPTIGADSSRQDMPELRRSFQAEIAPYKNVLERLRRCFSFLSHTQGIEPKLEARDGDEQLSGRFLQHTSRDHGAGWSLLRRLQGGIGNLREIWRGCSSHRLEPNEQCAGESCYSLPYLSCHSSQVESEPVSVVVRLRDQGEQVYDIQVEGNENFFANGVLVHNCMIIDDPLKDDQEAQSSTIRKALWNWFNKVMLTRCHKFTPIVIVHTRWHEDDLIGHLVDPAHPEYDPKIAADWTYINLPVVVKDKKLADALGLTLETQTDPDVIEQFGDKPLATLWPERKSLKFLAAAKRLDKKAFESLYEGNPAPDDGDYFKRDDLVGYSPEEWPKNLMMYGASDHALTTKEENDANCCGAFGVDDQGVVWISPDLYWKRAETDETLDAILHLMKHHKILVWFAEDEHINKSLGPFRRKKQREENIHTAVLGISPGRRDLKARARSIQGMTQLRKVRFPKFAHWWPEAENEMLKFPSATHDDFVSFLALIGLGLDSETMAVVPKRQGNVYHTGTFGWMKMRAKQDAQREKMKKAAAGM